MERIKAIIIDDEQHAIDTFKTIAAAACPILDVRGAYTNPAHYLHQVSDEQAIDILFLDVEMAPYSGFKLLENLKQKHQGQLPFDVIFLTAYDRYAIQAFGYNALDYLLKPLMAPELQAAIQKWQNKRFKQLHIVQLNELKLFLSTPDVKPDRMALPTLDGYEIIRFKDIIRVEADRNYTHIIDKTFDHHVACRTLKEVEVILSAHGFLRVHRSHIINPDFVVQILKESGGTLEMIDQTKITITQNREDVLLELFNRIKKL